MRSKLLLGLAAALTVHGQTPQRPAFEVASLKPSQSTEPARLTSNPAMWSCTNCRLFDLLGHAYTVFEYQIDAPEWTKSLTFDLVAKLPPGMAKSDFALMMQTLLEERFRMTVHREKRERPVYELVIAKGGSKLREIETAPPPLPPAPPLDKDGFPNVQGGSGMRLLADRGRIQFQWQSLANIAHFISTQVDRPVLDATGLKGHYAMTLSWFRESAGAAAEPAAGPTIFEAVQDQLGLKLQPKAGEVEMVVVDRAEKTPIGN